MLNREAVVLATNAVKVAKTATQLAAHQLGDEFNERTASTTSEARKSAPRPPTALLSLKSSTRASSSCEARPMTAVRCSMTSTGRSKTCRDECPLFELMRKLRASSGCTPAAAMVNAALAKLQDENKVMHREDRVHVI